MPDRLAEVAAQAKQLRHSEIAARHEREKLTLAVLVARRDGHTLERIAEAAGLTRQRVWQLTR